MDISVLLENMTSFLTIFLAIPAAVLCYIPMAHQIRWRWWVIVLHCLVMLIISALMVTWIGIRFPDLDGTVLLLPFLAAFFTYYALSVRANVAQTAGIYFAVLVVVAIASYGAYIIEVKTNAQEPVLWGLDVFTVAQIGLTLLLAIPMAISLRWRGVYLIDHMTNRLDWAILAAVSAFMFAILSATAPLYYEHWDDRNIRFAFLLTFTLVALAYLLHLISFVHISFTLIRNEEMQEQELIYRMQRDQYQQLEAQTEQMRVMRHDFRHTIGMLSQLAADNEIDELRKYLEKLDKTIPQQSVVKYCESDLINAILNYYKKKAEEQQTDCQFLVDLPLVSEEQTADLISLLGNLLNNALQGTETLPADQRGIQLRMAAVNEENLYILASNTFDGKVRKDGGRYLSTRRKRGYRGFGLRSIRMVAEKYGGEANIYHKDKVFYVDLNMRLDKAPAE